MSAYFCDSATFHLVATYAASIDATADLATVWRQLITENLRSLNHRYPYDQAENIKIAAAELALITDRPMLPLPAPGIIRSALQEFRYQACKHDGYSTSPVGLLVERLLQTIDAPIADHPAGWFPVDTLPQAQPQPEQPEQPQLLPTPAAAPTAAADPIEQARASLTAMFAAPAAPEPEPAAEPTPEPTSDLAAIGPATRRIALVQLLTLARVSGDHPDAERFRELAGLVGATLGAESRADASAQASANAAALRTVLDACS